MEDVLTQEVKMQMVCDALLESFKQLSHILRYSACGKQVDSKNIFGDIQLDADIAADNIIFGELKKTGLVAYGLSEENPKLVELGGKDYIVTFDPLDGSSIIGSNWTVGSIFGIWKNDEKLLIGHQGKDLVGAGCAMYGPRLTVIYYNYTTRKVEEHSLKIGKSDHDHEWIKTKDNININAKAKVFSPGNLRAVQDNLNYQQCIDHWINNGYTLRYTGGMVPDIYQIFIKGQGIFSTVGSKKHPAQLRVLYEVLPMAFLVQKVGGQSSDGSKSLLELEVTSYDQRSGIVVGSSQEVERVENFLKQ